MPDPNQGLPPALRQAHEALQKGRPADALNMLQVHLATAPDDVGALNLAGLAQLTMGRMADAVVTLESALKGDPDHVESLTHLGVALLNLDRQDEGIARLESAVALRRNHVPAQFNLGLAYLRAGRAEEVVNILKQVARAAPRNAGAWLNLGVAQVQAGERAKARESFRTAAKLAPQDAAPRRNLANLLVEDGDAAEAEPIFAKLVESAPDDLSAHLGLALVRERLGRRDEAIALYESLLARDAGHSGAHTNIAPQLERFGRFEDAQAHLQAAIDQDPGHPEPAHNLAGFLIRTRQFEAARRQLEEGAAKWPDDPYFRERLAGHLYRRLGDPAAGRIAAEQLLSDFPGNIGALELLAADPDYAFARELAEDLAARVEEGDDSAEDRGRLCFVLYAYWDRAGETKDAFAWLRRGNELIGATYAYKPNDDTVRTARLIKTFDRAFFESRAGWGDPNCRPIFIIGMPRSATTLVEQILSRHSQVTALGELRDASEIGEDLARMNRSARGFPRAVSEAGQDQVAAAAARYRAVTQALSGSDGAITDKMPGNFQYLGIISLMLPNARIIHCRRDPMDVCFSIYRHNFHGAAHGYGFDLTALGNYYRQHEKLMAHWNKVLPLPIHEIVYEDLVDDLEGHVRALLEYCELPFEEACLSFHESGRGADTASWAQVRQPLFRSSIGAWRRYEDDLAPLAKALAKG